MIMNNEILQRKNFQYQDANSECEKRRWSLEKICGRTTWVFFFVKQRYALRILIVIAVLVFTVIIRQTCLQCSLFLDVIMLMRRLQIFVHLSIFILHCQLAFLLYKEYRWGTTIPQFPYKLNNCKGNSI